MPSAADIAADLAAEQDVLDAIVSGLTPEQWLLPTPSPRWTVADQIGHLTFFDTTATLAITDREGFGRHLEAFTAAALGDAAAADDFTLSQTRDMSAEELLDHWRRGRRALREAAAGLTDETRIVWYGPSMGAKSFLTARLMEVWAHGQDIVDTVGGTRPATDRLRHIAQLGVITRGWTYVNRGLTPPDVDVRVELKGPSGETWEWGDASCSDRVLGDAVDFCLVVTQRRHVDDTALRVDGDTAREWLTRAQAFAGPATDGPDAGRFG